ncbi:methyltransferase domain-containing protein [Geobacter argillaceus]|uniref:Trans-aconitate 2-methyltransferase n=1 Tax=Geobacter argillaceus TaxID=345631 RepID=A0A562V8T6_9BACT|nr:methyltransferase domain-containing protein [Geobacter argillaceus]TWJ14310.1 trans-aconitate 2-methyltransferase [Geobacter argillaceus]
MPWDPELYHKFKEARFAPFEDLFALIKVREGLTVVDLGCGTGELSRRLADRLPESTVLGLDSSATMLEKAGQQRSLNLDFALGSIESATGQWDLVFSHAAIHWVEDHHALVPRLFSLVRPGGQLAVQLPSNHNHPAHLAIIETAREEPFRTALQGWYRPSPVLEVDTYAELLYRSGGQEITVLEKVYPALMPDAAAVAEWTSGTTLVPYFERLPTELHEPFLDRYKEKLRRLWPTEPVYYTFRRILFTACKSA